jgi:glutamate-ammonia-ligase adenylyltransferase
VFKEPPRPGAAKDHGLANHQFFKRLAESFIAEVSRTTPDGSLFRIDLRLRPEGSAGPLARSLGSYENFYAQWGQTWERMMLMKARGVAGDLALAAEFLEMIQPFRYPRSVGANVRREIAAMKARLETEVVKAGEIDRNVKLGRGGIREIEFIVQTQQLLHAGRLPFLQGGQTLPVLQKLAQYKLLAAEEAESLATAYCFLRDVEHRLQMEHHLQTHTIPTHRQARARLAALMGFAGREAFEAAREHHSRRVRQIYDRLFQDENPEPASRFPGRFEGAAGEWKALLARHGFRDLETSFRLLNEFAHGPGYVHVSSRTTELAWQLLEKLFVLCPDRANRSPTVRLSSPVLSDPDRVLARLDSFIGAYGARAVLFETWASNPSLFELWLLLFDRSEFLAELAIRTPDLVDELMLSGRLRRRKTADETLADLRHGRGDADQRLWLRRYHQAELMRIGLRDILGLADFEQNLTELSALADACLRYALEVVQRENRMKTSPLAVIGLGKLGGQELDYGADLDIIFIADGKAKDFSKLQRIAAAVMDLLSRQTELGVVFKTDTRLRPDGEKGLLVNTLAAHEEYYRHRAQLWEIQALTRARAIAGSPQVGEGFHKLGATLTNFRHPSRPLAALRPDWKVEIAGMRRRIESERTPPGQDARAIKTGAGGLIDAEFIAQTLCLANGWAEPNTLRALQRAKENHALKPADADRLIASYRQLRRVEGILRRWSFEGETVLPADPEPFYRVTIRCGFATAEAFRDAIAAFRRAIREVYEQVFPADSSCRRGL